MRKALLTLLLLAPAALVGALHLAQPALAAVTCPSCYGFADLGGDLFVERSATPEQRASAVRAVEAGRARVGAFYGAPVGHPRVLVCATPACYGPLGGGSRGVALLDRALILSPRGTDVVIAAHELAHAELHRRVGPLRALLGAVPHWFDEGLAVVVSRDSRYVDARTGEPACRVEPRAAMPSTRAAWIEGAASADLYAEAACQVGRWLAAHGGAPSVTRLAEAVAGGADFATAAR